MTAAQTPRTDSATDGELLVLCKELERELAAVRGQLEESSKIGLKYMAQAAEETRRAERAESALAAANERKAFYQRRCDALQDLQSRMRDPERTIVCDILGNGHLLPDGAAGDRYKIMPDAELAAAKSETDALREDANCKYAEGKRDGIKQGLLRAADICDYYDNADDQGYGAWKAAAAIRAEAEKVGK